VIARSVTAVARNGPQAGVAPAVQAVSPTDHHHRHHRDRRHHRHDSYDDGYCYGCAGPGSYCDASGCYYRDPYYGGDYGDPYYGDPYGPGGYRGGYGCGYDYPCGPPYDD
jgi:hypothetical protein